MPLLSVMLILIIAGVLLWLANTYLPMDATVKKILNIVVIVVIVLWLVSLFLPIDALNGIRVGHPR